MCQTVSWPRSIRCFVSTPQISPWLMSITDCRGTPAIRPALVTTGNPASCTASSSTRWVGTSTTTPSTPRASRLPMPSATLAADRSGIDTSASVYP